MIIVHHQGVERILSAAYIVYRDRVVNDNGTIADADAAQNALLALPTFPSIVQWVDARHGLKAERWYSICGQGGDATQNLYSIAMVGSEAALNNSRVISGGVWDAGNTPELGPSDDYTWGMHFWYSGNGGGILWGTRYGNTHYPNDNVWNFLDNGLWRSYFNGDSSVVLTLPTQQWSWVWCVKAGSTITLYNQANNVIATVQTGTIGQLPCGIGGGVQSESIFNNADLRYQTFIRAAKALTQAERQQLQAI